MGGVGVASATGGYFITQAYRLCEAALIAPFEYLALVLAIFWGITIFGEWPDFWAQTGIALILGSGLFVILAGVGAEPTAGVRKANAPQPIDFVPHSTAALRRGREEPVAD